MGMRRCTADFLAGILDMNWHEENNRSCALQIVDGYAKLFGSAQVARAQFPGRPGFQGAIAFNPEFSLSPADLFVAAVHELGHALGLAHSVNPSSVMYFLQIEGDIFLDERDLAALAAHHTLRSIVLPTGPVPVR